MKLSERLQLRIRNDLGIEVDLPKRIPRGRYGKYEGTWAWYAQRAAGTGAGDIGSEDTMHDCVTCGCLSAYRDLRGQVQVVAGDAPMKGGTE